MNLTIETKLAAFARRRRRLWLWRGLAALAGVTLGALALIGLLDRFVVMPDALRIALAVAAYLGAGVVWWRVSGRHLWRATDLHETARWVERAEPGLREDLLSAVELGESDARWDSPALRGEVQKSVAQRLDALVPEKLFPATLLRQWWRAAAIVVGVCALLLLIRPLQFERLFARAALPVLDLDRVSRHRIELLAPSADNALVPRGDSVPVRVRVTGGVPREVALEVVEPADGGRFLFTPGAREGEFELALPVTSPVVEFRIRAADALTRRHRIESRERPQAVEFEKRFTFPAYSGLAPTNSVEDHGDLTALEGAMAELVVRADQPVREGELQVTLADVPQAFPLARTDDGRWSVRVPVVAPGTYRVRLVAEATGFDNKFSPEYEIRPVADVAPQVEMTEPKGSRVASIEETVAIRGLAADDFGLASIARAVRINQEPWIETVMLTNCGRATVIAAQWPFAETAARPGDQVAMKLVALDTKGNRGETLPVQWLIAAEGFDARRLAELDARQRALASAEEAATAFAEAAKTKAVAPARTQGLQQQQAQLAAHDNREEAGEAGDKAWRDLMLAMRQVRAGRSSDELALAGNALARARTAFGQIESALNTTNGVTGQTERAVLTRTASELASAAASLAAPQRALLDVERADVAVERLLAMARDTGRAVSKTSGPETNAASRKLEGRIAETESVAAMLEPLAASGTGDMPKHARALRQSLTAAADAAKKSTADATATLASLQRGLDRALDAATGLRLAATASAPEAAEPSTLLQRLAEAQHALTLASRETGRGGAAQRKQLEADTLARWDATARALRLAAELEEVRVDADAQHIADLAAAADVLAAFVEEPPRAPEEQQRAADSVKKLSTAFPLLDAAHAINTLASAVGSLAGGERWEPLVPLAATARPRDWQWAREVLAALPGRLKNTSAPAEVSEALESVARGEAAGAVTVEMDARFRKRAAPVSQADALDLVAAQLQQIAAMLKPAASAASEAVRDAAPKLSERIAELAKRSEAVEARTRDTLGMEDTTGVEEADAEALAEMQERLLADVEKARDALRRFAGAQDLMDARQRELARDADDAGAMLRDPPRRAAEGLRAAASGADSESRASAMRSARPAQKETTAALKTLAEHFAAAESGKPEATRAALRAAEGPLGIQAEMDERYDRAQMLADLAQMTAQQQMEQLEQMLKDNPAMQEELSEIARDALKNASAQIEQAAREEADIGKKLQLASTSAKNDDTRIESRMKQLAAEVAQFAATDIPAAAKQVETASPEAGTMLATARAQAEAAARALKEPDAAASRAGAARPPMNAATSQLQAAAVERVANDESAAAKAARARIEGLASRAEEFTKRLEAMAKEAVDAGASASGALAQSAQAQARVNGAADGAAEAVARAARHEQRLEHAQMAEKLDELSGMVNTLAREVLPPVAAQMQSANAPASVLPGVEVARQALEEAAMLLGESANQGQGQGQQQGKPQGAPGSEAQQMARALDKLDQMKNGNPQAQQNAAQQAAQQMAQAQQQQAQSDRSEGKLNEQASSGAQSYYEAAAGATGQLPALAREAAGRWGQLPPQMARDLAQGEREGVTGEYRTMVDTYFRVIAERAREAKP